MHNKLSGLQFLRAAAALMVVCYHSGTMYATEFDKLLISNSLSPGFLGVDIFFVISGFIIYWIHQTDIGKSHRLLPFITKRAFRIFPIYWLFVLLKIAKKFSPQDILTYACALLLIPYPKPPFINVSWTLSYEMLFYAAFALTIAFSFRWTMVITIASLTALSVIPEPFTNPTTFTHTVANFFFNDHLLEFILGLTAAHFSTRITLSNQSWGRIFSTSTTALVVFLLLAAITAPNTVHANISAFVLADAHDRPIFRYSTIIVGLLTASILLSIPNRKPEKTLDAAIPNFLHTIGDASYSLYLCHGLIINTALHTSLFRNIAESSPAVMVMPIAIAIAASILLHRYVEKPFTRIGRDLSKRLEIKEKNKNASFVGS